MAKANDLTTGKVSSLILKFYFPMLLTNMLQQMYNIADTAIVGKGLGDNALAAVGNMSSLTFLIFGFSMGLANGFSVIVAQSFGAKDYASFAGGAAPAAAESAAAKKWVCKICGYVYEGDEVPEDYKCPICGAGKDAFEEA